MKSQNLMGLGIGIGAAIGAAIGSATHQIGAWLALGVGIGLAIAVGVRDRRNAICAKSTTPESKQIR